MIEETFVQKKWESWKRLDALSLRASSSPTQLTRDELHEFMRLYRQASGDLLQARTSSSNLELIDFLNDLVARAYVTVYRTSSENIWKAIGRAIQTAAVTFRSRKWFVFTSLGVFLVGGLFAFTMLHVYSDSRSQFITPAMEPLFDGWKEGKRRAPSSEDASLMASFYSINNPLVSLMTGALSISTFGLYGVQSMYKNGAILGALTSDMASVHKAGFLYVSILPHGITEMSGAIIAGASGLVFGWALINPGRNRRGVALRLAGKDGFVLLATGIAMMYIAAPIEAYISFNARVPDWVRIAIITISIIAWGLFWGFVGKKNDQNAEAISSIIRL